MINSFKVICLQCRKRLNETPDVKDSPKTVAPEVVKAVSTPLPEVVAAVSMPQSEATAACLSELDKVMHAKPTRPENGSGTYSQFVICTTTCIPGIANRYKSIRKNRRNNDCA